ncbi:CHST3-like protein [Mya arenaria]|uniref:CHST3-like protein n=1 Tax=Mya arenaria TaxID=6604 RepID=A0ABY7F300_MYAAR|nr:CHST3-like protein [Mya arenaria]
MLVAYKRTGSTFLGDLLGRRADVFYWYEPLAKGRVRNYFKERNLLFYVLCSIPEVWKPFVDCFKRKDESCAQVLQDSCKHSEHRMVKILRIDVKSVGSMLETNPRLKMVLLFRDPRGSMNSRLTTAFYQKYVRNISQISNNADMLCSRMRADMSAGKKLKIKYPGRVILLQYEDLDDSENKLNKLYDFLNIEPPKQRTVTVVKNGEHVNDKPAGFHPFSYRHEMPFHVNQIMNAHCSDIYKKLGLRKFENEDNYKNDKISVIVNKLPFAILP